MENTQNKWKTEHMALMHGENKMNDKGFALVTVLLLGSMSMVLIALGAYMISTGSESGGQQKRYQGEIERSAGAGELMLSQLILGSLTCTPAAIACIPNTDTTTLTSCSASAQIYFSPAILTTLDKTTNSLSACYLSSTSDPVDPDKNLVAIKLISQSEGNETAIIDIVYKIEAL